MSKVQVLSWDYERMGTGFRFFVFQDLSDGDLQNAFEMQISARLFGAQIGHADIDPIKNEDVTVNPDLPVPGVPPIQGRLDDWQAYDANGRPVAFSNPGARMAHVKISGFVIVKGALRVDVGSHDFTFDIIRPGVASDHPVAHAASSAQAIGV
jgi:hypothetical protein